MQVTYFAEQSMPVWGQSWIVQDHKGEKGKPPCPKLSKQLSAKGMFNNYLKVSVWRGASANLGAWQENSTCFHTISRTLGSKLNITGLWYSRLKQKKLENSLSENGISRSQTFSHFNSFGSILCALFSAFVFIKKIQICKKLFKYSLPGVCCSLKPLFFLLLFS